MWQHVSEFFPFHGGVIFHCMIFHTLSVDGCLSCFHLWAIVNSLLFFLCSLILLLKLVKLVSALGQLHLLFPLPGMLFSQILHDCHSHPCSSNATSSEKPSLITVFKVAEPSATFYPIILLYCLHSTYHCLK